MISGSLLLMPSDLPPPAGYVLVGTISEEIDVVGPKNGQNGGPNDNRGKVKLVIAVYRKL